MTAYKGILAKSKTRPQHLTEESIQEIKVALERTNGTKETMATIWKKMINKNIRVWV